MELSAILLFSAAMLGGTMFRWPFLVFLASFLVPVCVAYGLVEHSPLAGIFAFIVFNLCLQTGYLAGALSISDLVADQHGHR